MPNWKKVVNETTSGNIGQNAATATALATAGTLTYTGDVTGGSPTYTGGGDLSIAMSIADNVVTGEMIQFSGNTEGDIMYYNSSGNWARLEAGTSGHYLRTLGTGNAPGWASVPADDNIFSADLTQTVARSHTLLDNNASALDFSPAGKAGLLKIITTNSSEAISTSGNLVVQGASLTLGTDGSASKLEIDPATGTDKNGGTLTINAGQGTGTGTGGEIIFKTAREGGSSSGTLNAYVTAMTIDQSGNIDLNTSQTLTAGTGNFSGHLTVGGNLNVSGVSTITNTTTEILHLEDNSIVLNSGNTGGAADAGFIVEMGTTSTTNQGLMYDVTAGSVDTTGRWVTITNDDTDVVTSPTYVADVMQVRIDGAAILTTSDEVPVGHMQYHDGELYLRVED